MARTKFSIRTVAYKPELFSIHPKALAAHSAWSEAVPSTSHLSGGSLINREVCEAVLLRTPLYVAPIAKRSREYGVIANFALYHQITEINPSHIALLVFKRSNALSIEEFANSSRCLEAGGRGDPHKEFSAIHDLHLEKPWRGLKPRLSRKRMASLLGCSDQKLRNREPRV